MNAFHQALDARYGRSDSFGTVAKQASRWSIAKEITHMSNSLVNEMSDDDVEATLLRQTYHNYSTFMESKLE